MGDNLAIYENNFDTYEDNFDTYEAKLQTYEAKTGYLHECLWMFVTPKIKLKFLIFNMLIKHMNVEGRINIKFLEIDEKFCIFVVWK